MRFFRFYSIILLTALCCAYTQKSHAQPTDSLLMLQADSLFSDTLSPLLITDSIPPTDTVKLIPTPWQPYNLRIFLASKKKTFVRTGTVYSGHIHNNMPESWMIAWALGILIVVVIYKRIYPYQFSLQLAAVFNQNKFKELAETQTDIYRLGRFFTLFISVNVLSLAMYLVLNTYQVKSPYPAFILFLLVLAIVAVLHIVQRILRALYSGTFNQKEFISYYTLIQRSNGFMLSLYSLPLILICYYQNSVLFKEAFIYIMLIMLGLYSLYSLFKSISMNYGNRGSTLYLFLYLCSFEILPLFVMFKFISNLLFNG